MTCAYMILYALLHMHAGIIGPYSSTFTAVCKVILYVQWSIDFELDTHFLGCAETAE